MVLGLCLLASFGCSGGSSGYTVKGKLTHGGQPVSVSENKVVLIFQEQGGENGSFSAEVFDDSTYSAELPAGKFKVSVMLLDKDNKDKLENKYLNASDSPIEKEVTGATDALDVDIPATS
jgi:hypothetical protein